MHQAIAFAIASESCRKRPFATYFRNEDEILAISFAKPFAFATSQRTIRSFLLEIWWFKFASDHYPVLPFLVFLEFLVFSPSEDFLVFLSVFPFFSRDFRGSVGIKNPCFFGGFPLPFPKKTRKGRTGYRGASEFAFAFATVSLRPRCTQVETMPLAFFAVVPWNMYTSLMESSKDSHMARGRCLVVSTLVGDRKKHHKLFQHKHLEPPPKTPHFVREKLKGNN